MDSVDEETIVEEGLSFPSGLVFETFVRNVCGEHSLGTDDRDSMWLTKGKTSLDIVGKVMGYWGSWDEEVRNKVGVTLVDSGTICQSIQEVDDWFALLDCIIGFHCCSSINMIVRKEWVRGLRGLVNACATDYGDRNRD